MAGRGGRGVRWLLHAHLLDDGVGAVGVQDGRPGVLALALGVKEADAVAVGQVEAHPGPRALARH